VRMIKLVENTAVVVAGSILIVAALMAVAVLFLCAFFVAVIRRLKPRRVQRARPPVLHEISKMPDPDTRFDARPSSEVADSEMRCRQVELEIATRQWQTADWLRRVERLETFQQLKYSTEAESIEP
jgi:hypothetical protein